MSFYDKIKDITSVKKDEPMKNHTTFKIGGPAMYFAEPSCVEELVSLIKIAKEDGVKTYVIGKGSNLLVSDKGLPGLVISLGDKFSNMKTEGEEIIAEGGATLSQIAKEALRNSLTGFEFASGIPGSLGGAVYMNAGAYGGEMKDVIVESYYLDSDLTLKVMTEHNFSYRKSAYTNTDKIIVGAKIKLQKGEKDEIRDKMNDLLAKRREKQPVTMPSAGSVFKRPEGYFAGALIEKNGLKGKKIGGAKVSELHAGFIVNDGDATCKDVLDLIKFIQDTVLEKDGVKLETEVKAIE